MLVTEQSTPKTPDSEITLAEKKQQKKLFASWIKVDGQLICRWSTYK